MIIVNITTTFGRQDLCSATLWSLLNQSISPDKIRVWISSDAYLSDVGFDAIPNWLLKLQGSYDNLEVNFVKNTGPYRKIIPALREANVHDILVYADDDVVYGSNWLSSLLDKYYEFNGEYVIASRIRIKKKNVLGTYKSYNFYPIAQNEILINSDFIITGVGGCVLSKKHILDKFINLENFKNLAPRTDDLWISKILELSGTSVLAVPIILDSVYEIDHSVSALNHTNTVSFNNSRLIKIFKKITFKILGYFGCALSNNDLSQKSIDSFFSGKTHENTPNRR